MEVIMTVNTTVLEPIVNIECCIKHKDGEAKVIVTAFKLATSFSEKLTCPCSSFKLNLNLLLKNTKGFSNTFHSPGLSERLPFLIGGCSGCALLGCKQECNSRQSSCSNSVQGGLFAGWGYFARGVELGLIFIVTDF